MNSAIIPLFSSSASLKQGGIFTVEKAGSAAKAGKKRGPVSLCDLAKQESLKKLHLVESNMVNFMSGYKNLKEVGCDLVFGLKVVVCEDVANKSETSFKTESKVIIFLKNSAGYKNLIGLYSKAAQDGFYYVPRLDWKTICANWSDDLIIALPFYSSFLAVNTLTFSSIVPTLPAKPVLLSEMNKKLPFDGLLGDSVVRYAAANSAVLQPCHSIYYKNREDSKKWMIWSTILRRTTYDKPNMDFCCSREFCWQAFKEATT